MRNGFVGGFPNMIHAEKTVFDISRGGQRVETVNGTVPLWPGLAEWADVLAPA